MNPGVDAGLVKLFTAHELQRTNCNNMENFGFWISFCGVYLFFAIVVASLSAARHNILRSKNASAKGIINGVFWPVFVLYYLIKK
jgi:hypothetical protein